MDQQDLATAKYVALTTHKRNGDAVSTPMWIVGYDGVYEMMTADSSWKVTRIRNNPQVALQVSDMKGQVEAGSVAHTGTATILAGDEATPIIERVRDKYGLAAKIMSVQRTVVRFLSREPSAETVGIRITIG